MGIQGIPLARANKISTLIVDGNLDMTGAFKIKADHIAESTLSHGVFVDHPLAGTAFQDIIVIDALFRQLLCSYDTAIYRDNVAYGKMYQFTVPAEVQAATVTVFMHVSAESAGTNATCRVYINGAAIGAEHANSLTAGVDYSDAILGLVAGDTIEIWGKTATADGSKRCKLTNFRIYGRASGVMTPMTMTWVGA